MNVWRSFLAGASVPESRRAGEQENMNEEQAVAKRTRVVRYEFSQLHKEAWKRPDDIKVRLDMAELAQELGRFDLTEV